MNLIEIKLGQPKNLTYERYNKDYESLMFTIESRTYRSRLAKLTPKKKGYFAVLWTKDTMNKNTPYSYESSTDFILILISDSDHKGFFTFPKDALRDQGILKSEKFPGKMAFRVYPSWCTDLNQSAQKTQAWQLSFFTKL